MSTKQLGQFGENIACGYLKKKGYRILARNYTKVWDDKTKGEIDIVARKRWNFLNLFQNKNDKTIHFVEVKTQETGLDFYPEDKVDFRKRKKLVRLAEKWLEENNIPPDSFWQIDVIGILTDRGSNKVKISHFENAVSES